MEQTELRRRVSIVVRNLALDMGRVGGDQPLSDAFLFQPSIPATARPEHRVLICEKDAPSFNVVGQTR